MLKFLKTGRVVFSSLNTGCRYTGGNFSAPQEWKTGAPSQSTWMVRGASDTMAGVLGWISRNYFNTVDTRENHWNNQIIIIINIIFPFFLLLFPYCWGFNFRMFIPRLFIKVPYCRMSAVKSGVKKRILSGHWYDDDIFRTLERIQSI